MKYLYIYSLLFLLTHGLYAQLEWVKKELNFEAGVEDAHILAVYSFKNISDKSVHISQVKSSCGCTVPELDKNVYAPGEAGVIKARFDFGSRKGKQEKSIKVYIDDASQPSDILKLTVMIPEVATIKPAFLLWKLRDPIEAKKVSIEAEAGYRLKILSAEVDNPGFSVGVDVITEGQAFEISVSPSTDQPSSRGKVTVETLVNGAHKKSFSFYMRRFY